MSTERPSGTITLITNSLIRYEGTLGNVDANANTVSLTNVRVFGTEGRAQNGQVEVPPSNQMFDQIIFRGSDITDLTVFDPPRDPMSDPAILSAQPSRNNAPAAAAVGTTNTAGNNNSSDNNAISRGPLPRPNSAGGGGGSHPPHAHAHAHAHQSPQGQAQRPRRFDRGGNDGGYRRGGGGGGGGGAGYRVSRRSEHTGQDFRPATGAAKEEFKEEFDFSKSREEFEKKKSEFEKAKEDAKTHSKAYDKSSFFDKISCDALERHRSDREGMKRADAETFGSEMVGSMRGPRRGRGGRGRYGGRY